ncbi:RNA polymerase factor sigma-54 [Marinilongibacter aquaticus]|uniref:RNA polymerase factor sigma-54 n=1 Tax=Marinilongibacter aquaticus TaxID=2975157 RepID=UPI0021BD89A4|nr:RNA polymerase factor sigma-54 [Marinilongibacter aquaticus]UBM60128.1 RNA polymerase factor sigma-54 [Marinilongibacter aquaticus]
MQKLVLNQSLQQRLSPQQIQFIKLLQVPTFELDHRIQEELEVNPALEMGNNEPESLNENNTEPDDFGNDYEDVDIGDYLNQDEYSGYKMYGDGWNEENETLPIADSNTLTENLLQQLGYLRLNEIDQKIGEQLIGSIDDDGYIRRPLRSIANDLAFGQNIYVSEQEVNAVLQKIQLFDPPGIAARDLRECLLLQLDRFDEPSEELKNAHEIVKSQFEEFTKKHYSAIQKKLDIDQESLKEAIDFITHLNPKPGGVGANDPTAKYLLPDFMVTVENDDIEISLNSKNAPDLRISKSFSEMLDTYDKSDKKNKAVKETVTFVKQKLDAAKWFIDAIKQRQQTLLRTMEAIVAFQKEFFLEGDESKLKPMILKDISDKIDMDISTVSRVANSKSVQTDFGIYPLKYFFSEGISTESGEDASSREVKNILKELIDNELKSAPLSDDKLEKELKKRGYKIARRTVAKYREQLNIPVARLRKEL